MQNTKSNDARNVEARGWEQPTMKYVGHVGEIFLFPGGGKVSLAEYDSGDTPFKPKGQECPPKCG